MTFRHSRPRIRLVSGYCFYARGAVDLMETRRFWYASSRCLGGHLRTIFSAALPKACQTGWCVDAWPPLQQRNIELLHAQYTSYHMSLSTTLIKTENGSSLYLHISILTAYELYIHRWVQHWLQLNTAVGDTAWRQFSEKRSSHDDIVVVHESLLPFITSKMKIFARNSVFSCAPTQFVAFFCSFVRSLLVTRTIVSPKRIGSSTAMCFICNCIPCVCYNYGMSCVPSFHMQMYSCIVHG